MNLIKLRQKPTGHFEALHYLFQNIMQRGQGPVTALVILSTEHVTGGVPGRQDFFKIDRNSGSDTSSGTERQTWEWNGAGGLLRDSDARRTLTREDLGTGAGTQVLHRLKQKSVNLLPTSHHKLRQKPKRAYNKR